MNKKLQAVFGAALFTLALILLEHYNGGVVTHYPLADDSLPGITNWWGMLTIPSLTWIVLTIIEKRDRKDGSNETRRYSRNPYLLAGLIFGLSVGLLWEFRLEEILQYYIMLPWALALFLRVYLPESLLGFALGMLYTFGGVLPIGIGLILQIVGFLIYLIIHKGTLWVFSKGKP